MTASGSSTSGIEISTLAVGLAVLQSLCTHQDPSLTSPLVGSGRPPHVCPLDVVPSVAGQPQRVPQCLGKRVRQGTSAYSHSGTIPEVIVPLRDSRCIPSFPMAAYIPLHILTICALRRLIVQGSLTTILSTGRLMSEKTSPKFRGRHPMLTDASSNCSPECESPKSPNSPMHDGVYLASGAHDWSR